MRERQMCGFSKVCGVSTGMVLLYHRDYLVQLFRNEKHFLFCYFIILETVMKVLQKFTEVNYHRLSQLFYQPVFTTDVKDNICRGSKNKNHHRVLVDPRFMYFQNSRFFQLLLPQLLLHQLRSSCDFFLISHQFRYHRFIINNESCVFVELYTCAIVYLSICVLVYLRTWGLVYLCICVNYVAHSWFISVIDSNGIGPVQPVQVKQLKYEDHADEGVMGSMVTFIVDLGVTNHIPYFFGKAFAQLAWSVWPSF